MSSSNDTTPPSRTNAAFVAHWQRVGPLLDEIRREELRNFNYADHLEAIDALLEIGARTATCRPTSGLVEQQRMFQEARRRALEVRSTDATDDSHVDPAS
jgi:hypothetical protein